VTSKKKILIIEDEPHIVLGLTDALEFEGFAVVSAGTGGAGVQLAKQEKPEAVLLDLMLPDTNGFKVCEELRRLDAFVPIIILTARGQEVDKIRGLDAGADADRGDARPGDPAVLLFADRVNFLGKVGKVRN